ncbi:uncharacterized protein LOC124936564 isoform X2 [Impatiens glandulifera]|uniref:uncharacterized protein LOC124936564 isoform X2 n=1 Tax=Impatiens glandulifera TaxID=253017 RepID=UPI001FB13935|nr:uncharacterized protein LOC124936564 isoform X2 [Impatiens glandulifera]
MADFDEQRLSPPSTHDLAPPVDSRSDEPSASALPRFDPSRSIIRRKALIKDLAGVYHAECLTICQELLELQRECEESYGELKVAPPEEENGIRRKGGMMSKRGLKRTR